MKTSFVRDLQPNQPVKSVFLCQAKELRHDKNGHSYLSLVLSDRTGALDARMWQGADDVVDSFDRDDFVEVQGVVQVHRGRRQIAVHQLRPVAEAGLQPTDYFPRTEQDVDALWTELTAAVAAMGNPHLRALVEAFLQDPEIAERYRTAPAAKTLHHAVLGGLLEHVVSLVRLGGPAARHYPIVDPDLLLTGIVLHDLGKIYELDYRRSFSYTTAGQLLGHMAIVVALLHTKTAAVPGFPPRLAMLVEHLILSHHGRYEFGSSRLPLFPEALLLHYLDDLDSKMESMRASLANDAALEGEWTSWNASLDRPILKKDRFLAGDTDGGSP